MKVAVFSSKPYDQTFLAAANAQHGHKLHFFESPLTSQTTVLAAGFSAVCVFINNSLDAEALAALSQQGIRLLALRSAGFNHVDILAVLY